MTEANLHQPPSLLAVQHAVNSFTERLRCDKWDAVLPFEVACLHETSNVLEDLVFQHHDNILEFCCIRWLYDEDATLHKHSIDQNTAPGNLLQFFENSEDINYCILGNIVEEKNAVVVNETRIGGNSSSSTTILTGAEFSDLEVFSNSHRTAYNMTDEENLFVGVAWVTAGDLRLLKLFPSVIKVDDTCHTNNEKRPHLTITGQTSSGHIFTWLRAFLPNKSAATFRWIFRVVLPQLIGHTVLQRIMVVISDGDSQETSQLDLAIFQYFRHVQRVRCGWHIVEKGVQSHCPGEKSVAPKQKEAYKTLIELVKNWIYSWMRPGYCESEDEYHISKVLFFEYLSSHTCLSLCGENKEIQRQIIDFVTRFVLPHEDLFVFFRRKHIRHFDEYNNCSHEGTNYGLKSHAAGVLPGHSIDNAGKCLTYQAELKYTELAKLAARDFSSREVWSEMPSTEHLCMRAQALIAVDWTSRLKFAVRRSFQAHGSNLCWKAIRKEDSDIHDRSPIPRFQRIRSVALNVDGRLECDCNYFNRIGLPCRHIYAVICFECPSYAGPTQFDVSVIWWKSYFHLAYRKDTCVPETLQSLFEHLCVKDITGPIMPSSFNDNIDVGKEVSESVNALFCSRTVVESLRNYNSTVVGDVLQKWGVSQRTNIVGRLFGDSAEFNGMAQKRSFTECTVDNDTCSSFSLMDAEKNAPKRNKLDGKHREKLQSAIQEFLSVAEDAADNDAAIKFLDLLYSNATEMTVKLRAGCLQKSGQAKDFEGFVAAGTTNENIQRWVSLTQEKDAKRSRQNVSNNGMYR